MGLINGIEALSHKPSIIAYVGGRPLEVLTADVQFGWDIEAALATLDLATVPDWLLLRYPLEIWLGWDGEVIPVFNGFVNDDGRSWAPLRNRIVGAGWLKLATYKHKEQVSYSNQTDTYIVTDLLSKSGITNVDIEGDDVALGTVDPLVLQKGQAPMDLINTVDETLGYHTFDTPAGVVVRRKITTIPGAKAAFSYREGNAFAMDRPRTLSGIYNMVHVQGRALSTGSTPNAYRQSDNPLVPNPPQYICYDFRSEVVQTEALAGSVAARILPEVNRVLEGIRCRAPGNPYLHPAMTLGITSAKIDLASEHYFWLRHVRHSLGRRGFQSEMQVEGGEGQAGYAVDLGPHALFTYRVERLTYDVSGTYTPMYVVPCDGSASWDPDDAPDTLDFAWEDSLGGSASGDNTYAVAATAAELAAGVTVTLTVTDPDGNTDSLTQTIATDLYTLRDLYVAVSGRAEATNDGGETWNTWTPAGGVTVTATPRRNGETWGLFGCSNGDLVYTADYLATAPTTLYNFGSQVNAIWLNEVDANRCLVALDNGKVMLSDNLSLLASATWRELRDFGATVLWVTENPYHEGSIGVCVGAAWLQTDDEFTSERTLATFAGGTARKTQGSPWGNVAVGTAAEPCRDDQDQAHAFPVLDPVVSDVRAVTHHVRQDLILCADVESRVFTAAIGDAAFAQAGTITGAGAVNDMLADADDAAIVYAVAEEGLYVTFDLGVTWHQMRDYSAAGLSGLQVGYGGLSWQRVTATTVVSVDDASAPVGETVKALSLWNGSGNDNPPDGWRDAGFDDSAWGAAVVASVGGGDPVAGSTPIWPTATPVAGMEQALFRHTFALSEGVVTAASLHMHVDGFVVGAWLNNVFLGEAWTGFPTELNTTINPQLLLPGADNVLAVHIDDHYPSGLDKAWLSYELEVS